MYYWFASKDKESGYARKDSGHCRKIDNVHRLSSLGRAESAAVCTIHSLHFGKSGPTSLGMSLFLDSPLPTGTDSCCLSRAVSVSQSLSGLRSSQSQTHGCFC